MAIQEVVHTTEILSPFLKAALLHILDYEETFYIAMHDAFNVKIYCKILQASNSSPCSAAKALSARARSVTSSSPVPQAPSARLPQHHRIAPLLREGQREDEVAARVRSAPRVASQKKNCRIRVLLWTKPPGWPQGWPLKEPLRLSISFLLVS